MSFELVVGIGRRDAVGGPIVRLNGKFNGVPAGAASVNLMITDCKTVRRIKKLNLGAGGDAAFSLVEAELAPACTGLDPNADWYVFGQTPGSPGETSQGIKFPKGELGHDSESHDIKALKRGVIDRLKGTIRTNNLKIKALDLLAKGLDKYSKSVDNIDWVADKAMELSTEATDKMAALERENEELEKEIKKREDDYKKQFGR